MCIQYQCIFWRTGCQGRGVYVVCEEKIAGLKCRTEYKANCDPPRDEGRWDRQCSIHKEEEIRHLEWLRKKDKKSKEVKHICDFIKPNKRPCGVQTATAEELLQHQHDKNHVTQPGTVQGSTGEERSELPSFVCSLCPPPPKTYTIEPSLREHLRKKHKGHPGMQAALDELSKAKKGNKGKSQQPRGDEPQQQEATSHTSQSSQRPLPPSQHQAARSESPQYEPPRRDHRPPPEPSEPADVDRWLAERWSAGQRGDYGLQFEGRGAERRSVPRPRQTVESPPAPYGRMSPSLGPQGIMITEPQGKKRNLLERQDSGLTLSKDMPLIKKSKAATPPEAEQSPYQLHPSERAPQAGFLTTITPTESPALAPVHARLTTPRIESLSLHGSSPHNSSRSSSHRSSPSSSGKKKQPKQRNP